MEKPKYHPTPREYEDQHQLLKKPRHLTQDGYAMVACSEGSMPMRWSNRTVEVSRWMMALELNRWLDREELVYFVDGDRTNLAIGNLTMTPPLDLKPKKCAHCGKTFQPESTRRKDFCSAACSQLGRRLFSVTRRELHILVWTHPTEMVGAQFGVSGKAVEKRCKLLNLKKPGRGYWAKINAGKIEREMPPVGEGL